MTETVYNNQLSNTVGSTTANLLLLTLGKVYIKTGNNARLLDEIIQDIVDTAIDENTTEDSGIFVKVNTLAELKSMDYPGDGVFIYNQADKILYLCIDGKYVPIIDTTIETGAYVKKTGDVMTGQLEVYTNKAPFIIASRELVENLNALYFNGYSSDEFAKKNVDEYIYGNWTFGGLCTAAKNWVFKKNIRSYGDIITNGSMGSPTFYGGFSGQGWRMDGSTNTLTVDYLVVRKAMLVYELVVNEVSATNGSLWVSNSLKVGSVDTIETTDLSDLTVLKDLAYYIPTVSANIESTKTIEDTTYINYKYILYIRSASELLNIENALTLLATLLGYSVDSYDSSDELKSLEEGVGLIPIYYSKIGTYDENNQLISSSYTLAFNREAVMYYIDDIDTFETSGTIAERYLYYHYFGVGSANNFRIVHAEENKYITFKPGDILRCLKFTGTSIKYYDALVINKLNSTEFLLYKADSVFDNYTNYQYDSEGNLISSETILNTDRYTQTTYILDSTTGKYKISNDTSDIIADVQEGDDIVLFGNISDTTRQGALYLTSSDDNAPYMDVIDDVNRPDYSVALPIPAWSKVTKVIDGKSCIRYIKEITEDEYNVLDESERYLTSTTTEGVTTYTYYQCYETLDSTCKIALSNGKYLYTYSYCTKVRLGKLDGIYDDALGSTQPHGYGLYAENVYLKGEFILSNGKSMLQVAAEISAASGGDIEEVKKSLEDLSSQLKTTLDTVNGLLTGLPSNILNIIKTDSDVLKVITDAAAGAAGSSALEAKDAAEAAAKSASEAASSATTAEGYKNDATTAATNAATAQSKAESALSDVNTAKLAVDDAKAAVESAKSGTADDLAKAKAAQEAAEKAYLSALEQYNLAKSEAEAAAASAKKAQGIADGLGDSVGTAVQTWLTTNKSAVARLGGDYTALTLGSSGLMLINPDATYKTDETTGATIVNPDTIGNGDEYVQLQGDKIKFTTYETVNSRYKVIYTETSPQDWYYYYQEDKDSYWHPYYKNGDSYETVVFHIGYVNAFPTDSSCIGNCDSVRPVGFADLTNDPLTVVDVGTNPHGFNFYYIASTEGTTTRAVYTTSDGTTTISNVYYTPLLSVAGMFVDGMLNTSLINTSVLSVDKIYGSNTDGTNFSINKYNHGEYILYWPDGSIMNAKVFKYTTDSSGNESIAGCVEYFFAEGACATYGDLIGGTYTTAPIKVFDYFKVTELLTFTEVLYYTRNSSGDMPALSDWILAFASVSISVSSFEDIIAKVNSCSWSGIKSSTSTEANVVKAVWNTINTSTTHTLGFLECSGSSLQYYRYDVEDTTASLTSMRFKHPLPASVQTFSHILNNTDYIYDFKDFLISTDGLYITTRTLDTTSSTIVNSYTINGIYIKNGLVLGYLNIATSVLK